MALISNHGQWTSHGVSGLAATAQRLTRAAAFAMLAFALGAMGYAALPPARITTDVHSKLIVVHDRFGEVGQRQEMTLRVAKPAGDLVSIQLGDASFAEHYMLENSQPAANTVSTGEGGTILTFETPPDADTLTVELTLKPLKWGKQDLSIQASISQRVSVQAKLTQLVAP